MSYQRTDYTTTEGKKSSAYYEPLTMDAWDVFSRVPVALVADPVTGAFSEWEPPAPVKAVKAPSERTKPLPVTIRPFIHPLMIIPAGLFGLFCIWAELTHFGLK